MKIFKFIFLTLVFSLLNISCKENQSDNSKECNCNQTENQGNDRTINNENWDDNKAQQLEYRYEQSQKAKIATDEDIQEVVDLLILSEMDNEPSNEGKGNKLTDQEVDEAVDLYVAYKKAHNAAELRAAKTAKDENQEKRAMAKFEREHKYGDDLKSTIDAYKNDMPDKTKEKLEEVED